MNLHLGHIQSLLFFSSVELDLFYRLKDTGLVLNDVKSLTVTDYHGLKLPNLINSMTWLFNSCEFQKIPSEFPSKE